MQKLQKWLIFSVFVNLWSLNAHLEGILCNSSNYIFKENLRCECVSMINYRLSIRSIPAVYLYTPASFYEGPSKIHPKTEKQPQL